MAAIDPTKNIQKVRTEEEIRKALQNCIHHKVTMCVPPQIDDDDIVLYDAFKELKDTRNNISALWEIAREVAEDDPTHETGMGDVECVFCSGDNYSGKGFQHEDTCIFTKARKLIVKNEGKHE